MMSKDRRFDPTQANFYVENTMVGDPLTDAAVASLADFNHARMHELINAQLRRLLLDSEGWDVSVEGVPLHVSHMARPRM